MSVKGGDALSCTSNEGHRNENVKMAPTKKYSKTPPAHTRTTVREILSPKLLER
jgi:hypothetical protein